MGQIVCGGEGSLSRASAKTTSRRTTPLTPGTVQRSIMGHDLALLETREGAFPADEAIRALLTA